MFSPDRNHGLLFLILLAALPISSLAEGTQAAPQFDLETRIKGRLSLAEAAGDKASAALLPGELAVHFSTPPRMVHPPETKAVEGSSPCTVSRSAWWCAMPAGTLDLRFQAPGFVPVYLWDVELKIGDEFDLGNLDLRRGGSVLGRVIDPRGDPVSGAAVKAHPPAAEMDDPFVKGRLERMLFETTTNSRGFFQITDLPQGVYRITANASDSAPVSHPQLVTIEGDSEVILEDSLALQDRATFDLAVEPPRDPWQQPWSLVLEREREDRRLETLHEGIVVDGRFRLEDVVPGVYFFSITDSEGSRWIEERHEVWAGEPQIFRHIPLIEVEGAVSRDHEPVAGHLVLLSRNGTIKFEVEDEGDFSGYLPAAGRWEAHLIPSEIDMRLVLDPVEIEEGKSKVRLDIEVLDTYLEGEVITSSGEAAPEATILFASLDSHLQSEVRADDEGRFSIWGLPTGDFSVHASQDGRTSRFVQVTLKEGVEPAPLMLELVENVEIEGQVYSAVAPLPGARIAAWPDLGGSFGFSVERTSATMDGAFTLQLQTRSRWVNILVQYAGLSTRILRAPVDPDRPLLIELEQGGGSVVLDYSGQAGASRPWRGFVLRYEQTSVPLGILMMLLSPQSFSMDGGLGQIEFPNMASGAYELCAGGVVHSTEDSASAPHCSNGYLPPHGRLVLRAGRGNGSGEPGSEEPPVESAPTE